MRPGICTLSMFNTLWADTWYGIEWSAPGWTDGNYTTGPFTYYKNASFVASFQPPSPPLPPPLPPSLPPPLLLLLLPPRCLGDLFLRTVGRSCSCLTAA